MRKDGFTLVEIIIVIVVIGVMATLALPRLVSRQESAIFSEGLTAAQAYYESEQRYLIDHADETADCTDLDVTMNLKYFTMACANSGDIVTATRQGGAYAITVDDTGKYCCDACTPDLLKYLPGGGAGC